jgi:hypothetical protein
MIKDLYNSFFNNRQGFSARKLTAFASFITAVYLSLKLENENRLYAVYGFLLIGLLCLGIVTFQNIIDLKNGNSTEQQK